MRTSRAPAIDRSRPSRSADTEALLLFALLLAIALLLVFFLNRQTQWLAVAGAGIATLYPFMKRWTYLPQVVLGAAFSWGIVMAFAATRRRFAGRRVVDVHRKRSVDRLVRHDVCDGRS